MTELLPEFGSLLVEGIFDGELVTFGSDGLPSFEQLSRRILHGDTASRSRLFCLTCSRSTASQRCTSRAESGGGILELLGFGDDCHVCPRFDDGAALWETVCERGVEGVVAKRDRDPYRPGERRWIKQKNPAWSRYQAEREAVVHRARRRFATGLSSSGGSG